MSVWPENINRARNEEHIVNWAAADDSKTYVSLLVISDD